MKYCCKNLDDFLDGELSAEEVEWFQSSAESCSACQECIESQRRIDGLLRKAWNQIEVPSPTALRPTANSDDDWKSQRTGWELSEVGVVVIAASILIAIGGMIWALNKGFKPIPAQSRQQNIANSKQPGDRSENQADDSLRPRNQASQKSVAHDEKQVDFANDAIVKATLEFPAEFVGVRVDGSEDDFTFINVYQTYQPDEKDDLKVQTAFKTLLSPAETDTTQPLPILSQVELQSIELQSIELQPLGPSRASVPNNLFNPFLDQQKELQNEQFLETF